MPTDSGVDTASKEEVTDLKETLISLKTALDDVARVHENSADTQEKANGAPTVATP